MVQCNVLFQICLTLLNSVVTFLTFVSLWYFSTFLSCQYLVQHFAYFSFPHLFQPPPVFLLPLVKSQSGVLSQDMCMYASTNFVFTFSPLINIDLAPKVKNTWVWGHICSFGTGSLSFLYYTSHFLLVSFECWQHVVILSISFCVFPNNKKKLHLISLSCVLCLSEIPSFKPGPKNQYSWLYPCRLNLF